MKEKVISILIPDLVGAGAQRVLLNLAVELARGDESIHLVAVQAQGSYLKQIPQNVTLINLQASRIIFSIPALIKYLKKYQPNAMLTGPSNINIVAIIAKFFARSQTHLVITEHVNLSAHSANGKNWRSRLIPALAKYFYRYTDEIVAVSKGVANDLHKLIKIPKSKISVIYNPVITPQVIRSFRGQANHPWLTDQTKLVIIGVGRLTEQKNFKLLISALKLVREQRDASLIILGEGELRAELEAQVQALNLTDYVSLPGFVDNPYAYLKMADVFVLSSNWEGLPTVLIEALYWGNKIVSTDCPSGPSEILADYPFGHLVSMNNAPQMANAILNALSSDAPKATDQFADTYKSDSVAIQYRKVLGASL